MSTVFQIADWWARDYAYAIGRQLRSAASRVSPDEFLGGTGRPVVVIPGIYEDWRFMLPLIRELHAAGHPVHVVTVLQRNRLKVPNAAALIAGHLRDKDLRDVMIVAHSKGGLIGKYAMMSLDPERRISRMVAVCAPFSGSRYAHYMVLPSLRALSPRNAVTVQLAREQSVNERITSVYGLFDPHIPEGSVLPGARNVQLDTGGHFRILAHKDTIHAVLTEAEAPAPAGN
ncbi:triacylglycerol lipase [Arthrobacter sp. PAMC25284]|uniref:esterase/lipase family protein n=1 Tax=Arthrobacter sp. PAMC25284 TaxID=2861279 RepID=UPI001C63734E|nr:alpha/beta hydrolase [Arthrobacter sp. PAMC25284]QYF89149.1 alpha/beta hydrolase [Arthrobacter sp. PAMC25284]